MNVTTIVTVGVSLAVMFISGMAWSMFSIDGPNSWPSKICGAMFVLAAARVLVFLFLT